MQAGEAGTYTIVSFKGDEAHGLHEMEAEGREGRLSPHWFSYVSVEDTDATASRAHKLGGTVHGESFNVMESGRVAAIQGPTRAVLAAWEPAGAHQRRPGQRPQLPNLKRASEP